jgi:hypothetical protein
MYSILEINLFMKDLLGDCEYQDLRVYTDSRDDYEDDGWSDEATGSRGTFTSIPVGGNVNDEYEDEWEGGCFACWGQLAPQDLMTSISYQNPVVEVGSLPDDLENFLTLGWDTVIQPCFGTNLPNFQGLRTMEYVRFPDTRTRSLLEASLYFRLVRSYSECLAFPVTASILRNRYPTTSAAVLLALTCFGPCASDGRTGGHYLVDPNQTMSGENSIGLCLAMMRNWLWASEQGGWRIDRLNPSTSIVGPLSRRYFGHDYYWAGAGDYFKVELRYAGVGSRTSDAHRYGIWARLTQDWHAMDAIHDIFVEAEAEAKELAISEPLEVTLDLSRISGATTALAKIRARNRMW